MLVRHFKVHLAYACVATKRLRMCSTHKIFHVTGFMCVYHARMYADAPVSILAYFLL